MAEARSTDEVVASHDGAGPGGAGPGGAGPGGAGAGDQNGGRPAWPWFVSIGAAVALVVGLVWAAGGFEHRDDLATVVPVGQTFTDGPYEFSFTGATVQKTKTYGDDVIWSVVVSGTGRTTGDISIKPDDETFVVKDARSGAYRERAERQEFGVVGALGSGGNQFTPGLSAIPYRVAYQFPVDAFAPDSTIIFVAWQLKWRDVSLLQVGDYEWARTHDYFRMDLPLKRLPDDLDD